MTEKEAADARDALLEKLVKTASDRGLRLELEFDDQEMAVGDSSLTLNGKTIIEGDEG
ncbi:MAG: hypothetical protein SV186_04460 [Candidatus Nanohaloarchaea archaeon]|nr:hypothetical protein [Candidatus Nanohaloarchaea archaeon]